MSPLVRTVASVAALAIAAGAGLWAGHKGLVQWPAQSGGAMKDAAKPAASGPVIYYRDPDGKPFYGLTARTTNDGRSYVAVLASEDVSFDTMAAKSGDAAGPDALEKKIKFYRNPMGLPDISMVPKKDSMGMDYIAVFEGEDSDDGSVKVSPGKIQRTGVETVVAAKRTVTQTLKVPGVVQLDERRINVIAPRFEGFVEKVSPVTTGSRVKSGEALVSVFGQEVLNQAARLMIEQGPGGRGRDEGVAGAGNSDQPGGVIGARRRLLNLGVPEDFMQAIKRERRVPDTLSFRAPRDGVILERSAIDGQAFRPGDVLFRMADTSVVWIMADVAEGEIGALKAGQSARVTTRAYPGRIFEGKVAIIYPVLMKETRTARVRIELSNADLALLPDMYADVEIATTASAGVVAVPMSAVIDSGSRQVVLVDRGEGRFEPRDVKLGRQGEGFAEIVTGITEGDKIVVNGTFLIDAESNLQAALKGFTAPSTMEAPQ